MLSWRNMDGLPRLPPAKKTSLPQVTGPMSIFYVFCVAVANLCLGYALAPKLIRAGEALRGMPWPELWARFHRIWQRLSAILRRGESTEETAGDTDDSLQEPLFSPEYYKPSTSKRAEDAETSPTTDADESSTTAPEPNLSRADDAAPQEDQYTRDESGTKTENKADMSERTIGLLDDSLTDLDSAVGEFREELDRLEQVLRDDSEKEEAARLETSMFELHAACDQAAGKIRSVVEEWELHDETFGEADSAMRQIQRKSSDLSDLVTEFVEDTARLEFADDLKADTEQLLAGIESHRQCVQAIAPKLRMLHKSVENGRAKLLAELA